jgi:hypothetical protein
MKGIWSQVGFLFATDDGSLPSIWVNGLDRDGLAAAYAFLRSLSRTNPDVAFWHTGLEREERLDAWPNAAVLVADGQADPFHFLASGLAVGGVDLPDLGVFVGPEEVALDYRMGRDWDEQRVIGLFELLRRLAAFSPDSQVTLARGMPSAIQRRFLTAFLAYCRAAVRQNQEQSGPG